MIHSQVAGGLRKAGLGIDMFTQDELRDIHYATVEVLECAGLWVEDDEAMDVFASGGCIVDRKAHNVRIPAKVLEEGPANAVVVEQGGQTVEAALRR